MEVLDTRRIAALERPPGACAGARVGVAVPTDGDVVTIKVGDFNTVVGVSIVFCFTKI